MIEKEGLFRRLFGKPGKAFAMRLADIGEQADRRLNDLLQLLHLPATGNTRLENGEFMGLVQRPYAERHADLRIIALGTARDMVFIFQQLVKPFFYDGLSVAAGDADNRDGEPAAMMGGQLLQGDLGIIYRNDIGFGITGAGRRSPPSPIHDKIADAAFI